MSSFTTNANKIARLKLEFNGTADANVADNAASSPATVVSLSLHTASPGATGTPTTNLMAYGGYAALEVARTAVALPVNEVPGSIWASNAAKLQWPAVVSGGGTLTHVGASIGGVLRRVYALPSPIALYIGARPTLDIGELKFREEDAA